MTARNPDSSSELGGSLLLAHPSLRDENFKHTVILIASHDSEGAMGVVLNRPLDRCLGELNTEFGLSGLAQVPLFAGGPVQTTAADFCAGRAEALSCCKDFEPFLRGLVRVGFCTTQRHKSPEFETNFYFNFRSQNTARSPRQQEW